MDEDSFVFLTDNDKVTCGGYEINNTILNEGLSAISNVQKGGTTLAVPAGLFLLQQNFKSNAKPYVISREEVGIVGEDLYDKLLDLMTVPEKKKRLTRKKGTSKKKRTTRRRK